MSSPAEAETIFDKIQYPFTGIERDVVNLIRDVYKKPAANSSLSSKARQRIFTIVLEALDIVIRREKTQGIKTGQKVNIP